MLTVEGLCRVMKGVRYIHTQTRKQCKLVALLRLVLVHSPVHLFWLDDDLFKLICCFCYSI